MRVNLDGFVKGGGNAAILAGNACWWQVRFDRDSSGYPGVMTCYKYTNGAESGPTADPIADLKLKTVHWFDTNYSNWPENQTIGVSSRLGAIWANTPPERPETPFVVKDPSHWVFAGTGLSMNSEFGGPDQVVGYETDAFQVDQNLNPTYTDGTPYSMKLLAFADARSWPAPYEKPGIATLGIFQNNGTVFVAPTTDWVFGLAANTHESHVKVITKNVVTRLSAPMTSLQRCKLTIYSYHNILPNGGWNFYYDSSSLIVKGLTFDGPAFFAQGRQTDAYLSPIFRYYSTAADGIRRYLLSPSTTVTSGWTLESINPAFYAYFNPPAHIITAPIYRHHAVESDGRWIFHYSPAEQLGDGWVSDGEVFRVPV